MTQCLRVGADPRNRGKTDTGRSDRWSGRTAFPEPHDEIDRGRLAAGLAQTCADLPPVMLRVHHDLQDRLAQRVNCGGLLRMLLVVSSPGQSKLPFEILRARVLEKGQDATVRVAPPCGEIAGGRELAARSNAERRAGPRLEEDVLNQVHVVQRVVDSGVARGSRNRKHRPPDGCVGPCHVAGQFDGRVHKRGGRVSHARPIARAPEDQRDDE